MTDTTVLEKLLDRIDTLYGLPTVAVQVMKLTQADRTSAGVDFERLQSVIQQDPALTAKVLQAANSSVFGFPRSIETLAEALRILGTQALQSIVLALHLPQTFSESAPSNLVDYWETAITRSMAARKCAQLTGVSDGDSIMVGALLSDIGVLALLQELGDDYRQFLEQVQHSESDLAEMEIASLGFDHRTLSARMLDRWNFPDSVIQMVAGANLLKGNPASRFEATPAAVLHAADLASRWLTQAGSSIREILSFCIRAFQWTEHDVENWLNDLKEPVQSLAELLDISVALRDDYRPLLQQTAEEMRRQDTQADGWGDTDKTEELAGPDIAASTLERLDHAITRWADSETTESVGSNFFESLAQKIEPQPEGSSEDWSEDPGLVGRVTMAVQQCRMHRQPLSLILVQIDDFSGVLFHESVDGIFRIQQSILLAIQRLSEDDQGEAIEISDERFALLLPGLERNEAVRIGKSIQQLIGQWSQARSGQNRCPITLSLGCASSPVPARNFDARVLVQGAQRCLDSVQLGNGNGLKSIDVFY